MSKRERGTDEARRNTLCVCVQRAKSEYTLREGIQKHKLLKNKT